MSSNIIRLTLRQRPRAATAILDAAQKADTDFDLPWRGDTEWQAVFQSLRAFRDFPETWPTKDTVIAEALKKGLVEPNGQPTLERVKIAGQELYQAVFVKADNPDFEQDFQKALASVTGETPTVVFHFEAQGHYLQTYPWEILHDGQDFLFKSRANIVRHVDFPNPIRSVESYSQLRVLLVDPRPTISSEHPVLPLLDRAVLSQLVEEADRRLSVTAHDALPSEQYTFQQFIDSLSRHYLTIKVVHIDTHGDYGRCCPYCGYLSMETICPSCTNPIDAQLPAGHLAFTHSKRGYEWISGQALGTQLKSHDIVLAIITACSSALNGGGSVFNSVAGALIEQGIPATVAMQFPVEDQSTQEFVKYFYRYLLKEQTLARALTLARSAFHHIEDAWYRPALYLRTHPQNMEGRLFLSNQQWFQEQDLPGQLLTALDVKENAQALTKIILGDRATLGHLRDGHFMRRKERLSSAVIQLNSHLKRFNVEDNNSVPIFWIDGRSGSGKSVLLLQLIQRLITERDAEVIWLDNNSRGLVKILTQWVTNPPPTDKQWFIAIDDFFAPDQMSPIELEEIQRVIRNGQHASWPLVLTCGPTEQSDRFMAEVKDEDSFRILRWTIQLMDKLERKLLEDWYQDRTGKVHLIQDSAEESGTLIISNLFEMQSGSLKSFAQRFAARLRQWGLIEGFAPLLMLNRLYILAPRSWLSDEEHNYFRMINRQDDFTVIRDVQANEYLRLTHPHISNELYLATRPHADGIVYSQDLARAFERAIRHDVITLKSILRVIAEKHERLNIIDQSHLTAEFAQIIEANSQALEALDSNDALDFWLSMLTWYRNQRELRAVIHANPARRVYQLIEGRYDIPHWGRHWHLTWIQITAVEPPLLEERKSFAQIGEEWLYQRLKNDDYSWSYVWNDLMNDEIVIDTNTRKNLIRAGTDWIDRNELVWGWGYVYKGLALSLIKSPELLPEYVALTDLVEWGMNFLRAYSKRRDWVQTSFALIEMAPQLTPANFDEMRILLIDWLHHQTSSPVWSSLFTKLLQSRKQLQLSDTESPALLIMGIEWLRDNPDHSSWSYVLDSIVDHFYYLSDQEYRWFLHITGDWLEKNSLKSSWRYVWSRVTRSPKLPDDISDRLYGKIAIVWIEANRNDPGWVNMWQQVVKRKEQAANESISSLIMAGIRWLNENEDNNTWMQVWIRLVKNWQHLPKALTISSLLESGYYWLQRYFESDVWHQVWSHLFRRATWLDDEIDITDVVQLGIDWVIKSTAHKSWHNIWELVTKYLEQLDPQADETRTLLPPDVLNQYVLAAVSWVKSHHGHLSELLVFTSAQRLSRHFLLNLDETLAAVFKIDLSTLEHIDQHEVPIWIHPELNKQLLEPRQREFLISHSLMWLKNYPDHTSWHTVAQNMIHQGEALSADQFHDLLIIVLNCLKLQVENREQHLTLNALASQWDQLDSRAQASLTRFISQIYDLNTPDKGIWIAIWQALPHFPSVFKTTDQVQYFASGLKWVKNNIQESLCTYICEALFKLPKDPERTHLFAELCQVCIERVKRHGGVVGNSYIVELLINNFEDVSHTISSDTLYSVIYQWLSSHPMSSEWSFIWFMAVGSQGMFSDGEKNALNRLGLDWCRTYKTSNTWTYVWERLLERAVEETEETKETADEVVTLGLEWLKFFVDHQGWSFVWELMLLHFKTHKPEGVRDFLLIGYSWQLTRLENPAWPYIWQLLFDHIEIDLLPLKGILMHVAIIWLEDHQTHTVWADVLLKVVRQPNLFSTESLNIIIGAATNWLAIVQPLKDDQWTAVWFQIRRVQLQFGDPETNFLEQLARRRIHELTADELREQVLKYISK